MPGIGAENNVDVVRRCKVELKNSKAEIHEALRKLQLLHSNHELRHSHAVRSGKDTETRLQADLDEVRADLRTAQEEALSAQKDLQAKQVELETERAVVATAAAQRDDDLASLKASRSTLEEELEVKNGQLDLSNETIKKQRETIDELQTRVDRAKEHGFDSDEGVSVQELREQHSNELQTVRNTMTTKAEEEKAKLQADVADLEAHINELITAEKACTEEKAELNSIKEALEKEVIDLQVMRTDVDTATDLVASLRTANEALEDQVAELKRSNAQTDLEGTSKDDEIAQYRARAEEAVLQLEHLTAERAEEARTRDHLNAENLQLKKRIRELEEIIERLKRSEGAVEGEVLQGAASGAADADVDPPIPSSVLENIRADIAKWMCVVLKIKKNSLTAANLLRHLAIGELLCKVANAIDLAELAYRESKEGQQNDKQAELRLKRRGKSPTPQQKRPSATKKKKGMGRKRMSRSSIDLGKRGIQTDKEYVPYDAVRDDGLHIQIANRKINKTVKMHHKPAEGSAEARDNVAKFLAWSEGLGFTSSLFVVEDLCDHRNDARVLLALYDVARRTRGIPIPYHIAFERSRYRLHPESFNDELWETVHTITEDMVCGLEFSPSPSEDSMYFVVDAMNDKRYTIKLIKKRTNILVSVGGGFIQLADWIRQHDPYLADKKVRTLVEEYRELQFAFHQEVSKGRRVNGKHPAICTTLPPGWWLKKKELLQAAR
mmetsp:Transcript_25372/g.76422  ORF Transcript_25372/g.76422 Transcript_25372/m.76422 type:complete len:724 (+) Transcript_25372:264-2435(+)